MFCGHCKPLPPSFNRRGHFGADFGHVSPASQIF
jgi:hypothetical protein